MKLFNLRNSILATIVYYDAFDFPLTFAEVYKYLINPRRFARYLLNREELTTSQVLWTCEVNAAEIITELDNMARAGVVSHKNGFYFLSGKEWLYESRIEKDKLANRKWKKFLRAVKYLQTAPYLKAVFASGSLAANNPEPKSDFDVFIIIKSSRLYTGRFFLWLISSALKVRRGRFDITAPDKLCFNHYITDDNLELSHRSLYIAQSALNMKPVIFSEKILDDFSSANKWVNEYCYNFKFVSKYRSVKPDKIMLASAKIGELILGTVIGDLFETVLKRIQQRRIRKNPATYEPGGRIIFTDKELEFHPRSFEAVVIQKYNDSLRKLSIIPCAKENDSGLKQQLFH